MKQQSDTSTEWFDQIVNHRRAIRQFDNSQKVPDQIVENAIQRGLLAPNSSNLQLWEFHRVKSTTKKEQMVNICLNQSAAVTAQEFIAVVVRRDKWRKHANWNLKMLEQTTHKHLSKEQMKNIGIYYRKLIPLAYTNDSFNLLGFLKYLMFAMIAFFRPVVRRSGYTENRIVIHKSAALAAQTIMLSIASDGYDTCPMEGFDSARAKHLLKLPAAAEISMIIAIGKRAKSGVILPRLRVNKEEVLFQW